MLDRRLIAIAMLMSAPVAYAQSATAPRQPGAAEQQQNQQMERAALQVAQMVDRNQLAQLWDGASSVARQSIGRDAFVHNVDADRRTVGTPVSRNVALVTYSQSDGRKLPPGLFANIAFATRFANEKQPVRELISFHLDNDHVWRVSGYTLR